MARTLSIEGAASLQARAGDPLERGGRAAYDCGSIARNRRGKGAPMGSDVMWDNCFRSMVEASPAAMIMTGANGEVRYANPETERMFGYHREELIGRPIELLVPTRLRRVHASYRRAFLAAPTKRVMGYRHDLRARRRGGAEFPVEIGLVPVETPSETVVMAMVVDCTQRCETEDALAQSIAELERSNERLAQFAYVASLDLQEPLLEIVELSERLETAIASSNRVEICNVSRQMRSCALDARKLVDDLLIYARTIYGDQQLEILELREEVQFSLADLTQLIAASNTQVRIEIPAVAFIADRSQFARLLQNIVANAIKYRKPGSVAKVDITAALEGESAVRLAIVDNGVGFDEEFAQRIFEPFSRPRSKIEYAGTGIELAICKSIADRHGWSISVKSHPGEGATFFFTIPTLFAVPTFGAD